MAMSQGQIDAMNNYANSLAEAIYHEMAPLYFPGIMNMNEEDRAEVKRYYATLGRAFYKFNNGLSE